LERNAHFHSYRRSLAIVYAAVIAIVIYPALHEDLGAALLLWNCFPPTLGLLAIGTALDKSRVRRIVSTIFAIVTAIVAISFSAAWFFTPLDLDPHSGTTKLVFVFAPIISLGLAAIVSSVAWIGTRAP
jgi:membrane protein YdbS with pleckstrin-like domain